MRRVQVALGEVDLAVGGPAPGVRPEQPGGLVAGHRVRAEAHGVPPVAQAPGRAVAAPRRARDPRDGRRHARPAARRVEVDPQEPAADRASCARGRRSRGSRCRGTRRGRPTSAGPPRPGSARAARRSGSRRRRPGASPGGCPTGMVSPEGSRTFDGAGGPEPHRRAAVGEAPDAVALAAELRPRRASPAAGRRPSGAAPRGRDGGTARAPASRTTRPSRPGGTASASGTAWGSRRRRSRAP